MSRLRSVALCRRPVSAVSALVNPSATPVHLTGQTRSFGSEKKGELSIHSSSSSSSSNSNISKSNSNNDIYNNNNFNNNGYRTNYSLTFISNNMKLKREGGGFRFFSKVPISSPNEEGKPWYQPELDPKYSTAAKELQEENEGLGRYSCFFFF